MSLKLKICGMKLQENILEVAALKPDYMGFIFYRPSKRYVEGLSPEFVKNLPVEIKKTGVFVDEELQKVSEIALLYGLNAVQLHGNESPAYCTELSAVLSETGVELIKAFGVDEHFDFSKLDAYAPGVDYFLFDTQTPDHGGSGKLFNWSLLADYQMNKPYFLSGGIGPDQIDAVKAIKDARFYALDVNSRFELAPGLKDIDRLKNFKIQL